MTSVGDFLVIVVVIGLGTACVASPFLFIQHMYAVAAGRTAAIWYVHGEESSARWSRDFGIPRSVGANQPDTPQEIRAEWNIMTGVYMDAFDDKCRELGRSEFYAH